jgi:hypothetical protein
MKKIVLMPSMLAAALLVLANAAFAQNFVNYSSAYGSANASVGAAAPAVGQIGASDFGFRAPVPRTHDTAGHRKMPR